MTTKQCSKCHQTLPINLFSFRGESDKNGNRKRRNTCKDCCNKREREKYQSRKEGVTMIDNALLASALLELSRYDMNRVTNTNKSDFERFIGGHVTTSFSAVKEEAINIMTSKGMCAKQSLKLSNGNYLICGDSFGKHTKTEMFMLLSKIIKERSIDMIIHVGEALDDDNEVSNRWNTLGIPCVFVAKANELEELYKQQKLYGFSLVQDKVELGNDLVVTNQEVIQPYVRTSIDNLDQYVYNKSTICNCTRHEYFQRSHSSNNRFIASPGTLAVPFVKQTIKQFSFTDGFKSKLCYTKNFIKYRRMKEIAENYWENGIVLVNIKDNATGCSLIRIKQDNDNYSCVIDGYLYSTDKIDYTYLMSSTLVCADLHTPNENVESIGVLNNIIKNKDINDLVLLGDVVDGRPVNPHVSGVQEGSLLEEVKSFNKCLSFFSRFVTGQKDLLIGNHDGFYDRFLKSFPAFYSFFKAVVESVCKHNGYWFWNEKTPLETLHTSYWHGSCKIFGQSGKQIEQMSKNFDSETVVIGHSHRPQIRYGTYSVPCLCKLDQGYNTPASSNWATGFAIVTETGTHSYCQLYIINESDNENKHCFYMNEPVYTSDDYVNFKPDLKITL